MKKAQCRKDLKGVLEYLENFISASKGVESRCGCFDKLPYDTRKEHTKYIAIYLETWVLPELRKALKELEK